MARLSRIKDYETLLRAAALLRTCHPETALRVRIVGAPFYPDDHRYAIELRLLVSTLGLNGSVEFAGSVPNHALPAQYRASDVVVNSSRTGSVDKVVLEAMACGVPALTCNEAFVRILGPLAGTLMFAPGDAASLADRLASLLALSPQQLSSLGRELRAIVVRDHSLEGWVGRMLDVFTSLAARGSLPADASPPGG